MPLPRLLTRLIAGLGLLLTAGCDELTAPAEDRVPESELTFIRVAADAPPLTETTVSFWARKGETREVQIQYAYANGSGNGKCLLFRVPADALLRYADGTTIEEGDSVLITIRVPDVERFRFEFQPAGLQFDPDHPAEIEVRYRWADPDHNGDGVVDSRDASIEERFGFWRQGFPGEDWERILTTRDHDVLEARAKIRGFSQFALASN